MSMPDKNSHKIINVRDNECSTAVFIEFRQLHSMLGLIVGPDFCSLCLAMALKNEQKFLNSVTKNSVILQDLSDKNLTESSKASKVKLLRISWVRLQYDLRPHHSI